MEQVPFRYFLPGNVLNKFCNNNSLANFFSPNFISISWQPWRPPCKQRWGYFSRVKTLGISDLIRVSVKTFSQALVATGRDKSNLSEPSKEENKLQEELNLNYLEIQDKCLSFKIFLIKGTPTKCSIFKCPLRRDIITWNLNLKDLVTNGQGK